LFTSISNFSFAFARFLICKIYNIDVNSLKEIIEKKNYSETEKNLLQNFDIIQGKLMESQEIIENTLKEVSEQKKIFEKMSSDAEICKNILEINEEHLESVRLLFERPIRSEGKKATINSIVIGAIFCILGVGLGYLLAQM
jgi:hypothetical protein